MTWESFLNYTSAFLGVAILLVTTIAIPEVRKTKLRFILSIGSILILTVIGFSKIHSDQIKDEANEKRRKVDSATIQQTHVAIGELTKSYKNDSSNYSEYKKALETKFHIKDSANIPVQVRNYKPTFNTNIGKARDVKIG